MKTLLTLLLLLAPTVGFSSANDSIVKLNLVIVLDEKLLMDNYYDFHLERHLSNRIVVQVNADYSPGHISINKSSFDSLFRSREGPIYLVFKTRTETGSESVYSIELNQLRADNYFLVLKFFTYKKCKKYFLKTIPKTYFTDVYYPGGGALQVTRKYLPR
jgi:hypothetical protein